MSIAFCSMSAGEAWEKMASLTNPGKRDYCQTFGYSFIHHDGIVDHSRPPSWSKIPILRNALDDHEWAVWTDVDSVLWSPSVGVRKFIAAAGNAHVVLQENHEGINCGVILARNHDWTRWFLDLVYDQVHCIDHPWWEQQAIIELLQRKEVRRHVLVLPASRTEAKLHGFYDSEDWHSVLVHFPGIPVSQRLLLVENVCRLARFASADRLLRRSDFGDFLNQHRLMEEGVEIGVASGEFSRQILECWEGKRLHLVDAWRHLSNYDDVFNVSNEEHEARMRHALAAIDVHAKRTQVHRCLSSEAATLFADAILDFVYIDANPSYDAVSRDLRAWSPKVRPGGLLAGHDYVDGVTDWGVFGVKRAVNEFADEINVRVGVTTEREWPSWYFFKPSLDFRNDSSDSHL